MGCGGSKPEQQPAAKPAPAAQKEPEKATEPAPAPQPEAPAATPAEKDRYSLKDGETATIGESGKQGMVLKRTMTDVCLKLADGTEEWHDIDDINATADQDDQFKPFDITVGEMAFATGSQEKGRVMKRTTTDVFMRMEDGTTKWLDVEDIKRAASQEYEDDPYALKLGDTATVVETGTTGEVLHRNIDCVKLKMTDGAEKWFDIDMVRAAPPAPKPDPPAPKPASQDTVEPESDLIDTTQQKRTCC